ncbi:MAG: cation transporter, partial [Agromyces sp.]
MTLQQETRTIDLGIEGMTCASCVSRVEKRLGRLEGVEAEVNLATEKARVSFPSTTSIDELVEAVRAAGYTAHVPEAPVDHGLGDAGADAETDSAAHVAPDRTPDVPSAAASDPLMTRLVISAALTVPVVVIAMVPVLQFTYWQWFSLVLAAPVVVWGGWPFHRAAAVNLRHGSLTMDTLVSLGTLTAFAWSLWALFFGHAGMPGMTHEWT